MKCCTKRRRKSGLSRDPSEMDERLYHEQLGDDLDPDQEPEWLGAADPEQFRILGRDGYDLELPMMSLEVQSVNRGSREYIGWVQRSLNRLIGAKLVVDGINGRKTRRAVREFQFRAGLSADGIVGRNTEAALIGAGATHFKPYGSIQGSVSGSSSARKCPKPASMAVDRCQSPPRTPCPALPDLLCARQVNGIPFEYVQKVIRDRASGLNVVTKRRRNAKQRFNPSVKKALVSFTRNLQRFGMPIEAILSLGSLYCRCVANSNTLSNHSFGEAIDIAGVRWSETGGPPSRLRETIVHNYRDSEQRALLLRINACLRLSFATVIDYNYNKGHRNHFHVDTNRGRGRNPRGRSSLVFVQEGLTSQLHRKIQITGRLDEATQLGLKEFSGLGDEAITDSTTLNRVVTALCERVATGE